MSSTHWHVQCCDWHDHGRSAFPCAHAKPVHASYSMADATFTFILFSNSRASSTLAPAPTHPVLGLSTGIAHYTPHAVARVGRLALVAVVVTHAPPAHARTHTRTRQRYTTARTPATRIRHPEHSFRTFLLRFLGTTSTRSQPPPPAPTANGEGSRQSRVGSGKEGGGEKPRAPHSPGNTACVPGLTPRSRASQPPRCEASATPRVCRGTGHPPLAPRVHG